MGLTQEHLVLSDAQLQRINDAIERRLSAFYQQHPDEDPPDSMSVTFTFVFGFGREIEIRVGGLSIAIDD